MLLRHRAWRYRLRLDPHEITWMRRMLSPGDVALDVGAHKGAYTYWMRRGVGASGRVYAFEPQAPMADYLVEAVGAFRWRNVFIQRVGLSSGAGERTLHVPVSGPSPSASFEPASVDGPTMGVRTAVETLDGWTERTGLSRALRLIKCDVEGHELDVFRGGLETLRRDRPLILFECEERHSAERRVADVLRFLEDLGYRGHFYWRGKETAVEDFEPAVHQVVGSDTYVNDFIFQHGGTGV